METKHEKKRIGTISTAVAQTNLQCRVVAQARTAAFAADRGSRPGNNTALQIGLRYSR